MPITAADLFAQYRAVLQLSDKNGIGNEVSRVSCTDNKYEVKLDLQSFSPEEICVRAVDRFILVEGRHEKKEDGMALISHQFTRRYALPEGVEPENVKCSLGPSGVLTLSAPRSLERKADVKEVIIPINKKEKDDENDESQSQ